jgi:hypothetical protein
MQRNLGLVCQLLDPTSANLILNIPLPSHPAGDIRTLEASGKFTIQSAYGSSVASSISTNPLFRYGWNSIRKLLRSWKLKSLKALKSLFEIALRRMKSYFNA